MVLISQGVKRRIDAVFSVVVFVALFAVFLVVGVVRRIRVWAENSQGVPQ